MRNVEIIVIRSPSTIIQCNCKTKTSLNCFRHFFVTCVFYGINLISHSLPYYVLFYQTRFNKRWHAIRSSEVRVVSLFLNSFNKSFVYMKCKSHVISNMHHRKNRILPTVSTPELFPNQPRNIITIQIGIYCFLIILKVRFVRRNNTCKTSRCMKLLE